MNDGVITTTYTNSEVLTVLIECKATSPVPGGQAIFDVMNAFDVVLLSSSNFDATGEKGVLETSLHTFECEIPLNIFRAGQYSIRASAFSPQLKWTSRTTESLVFQVIDDSSPIRKLGQK